jgi:FMN phosphatase YigB (HAD superfamily)
MQLFIDIDGVLLDFERAFVRWLNERFGLGLPADYQAESWDFDEVLPPGVLQEGWQAFLDSPLAGELPPLVAPERFNRLAAAHSVHLVTNFPEPHMAKRQANLEAFGFVYDTLHYCGLHGYRELRPQTKAQVIQALRDARGEGLFVDDHPDNCVDVHHNCPDVEVWLMSRRFNRGFAHPAIRRAADWDALFARLEQAPACGDAPSGARRPGAKAAPSSAAAARLFAGK